MHGIKTIAKNLREAYVGEIRSKGLDEGEKQFKKYVSKLNKKHGFTGAASGEKRDGSGARISFKGLAEGIFGEGNFEERYKFGSVMAARGALMESVAAVDVSAFSNITGQLLIDRIRDNYDGPQFIGDRLFEIAPVVGGNLGTHREPWLSRVKDDPGVLQPQESYPFSTFSEQYIDLPAVEKRGLIVAISLEMITADKTKQAMARADDVGYRLRFQREERQLRVVAGIVNNFKYMGTGYNTYQTSGLWINKQSGVQVTDYRGIATIETLFANMTDLVTGKAIEVDTSKMMILCVPTKVPELKIALHAARTRSGVYPTSGATNALADYEGVPLINDVDYPFVSSKILYHLLTDAAPSGQAVSAVNAKEYLFMGHFQKAFVYREVMPFNTMQAPPGNPAEFHQDIIVQVRAMEWGVAGVQGPQQVAWVYNS